MESQIPDKVSQSQYCRELATTNKYECDFRFYEQLQEELKLLELWDEFAIVSNIKDQVVHIKEMTIKHAKSLDEDETPDEKQVRQIAESIREALLGLDTSSIPQIVQKMNSTNAKSITRLVLEEVAKEESGKYSEMVVKLFKTVHNPQTRTESILTLGLFYLLNNQNAEKIINTYRGLIDRSIEQLKRFKPLLSQITYEQGGTSQILSSQKFVDFVEGTKTIYQTTIKLYDVFRILSGQATYKFKLGNLRVEINQGVSELNQGLHAKFQPIGEESLQTHKRQLSDYVTYLRQKTPESALKIKSQVCSFCLLPGNVVNSGSKTVHPTCWNVIRILSKK